MDKEISTVENQRIVIVSKEIADKNHPYSVINLAALDKAAILKNSEFKLWLYLAKNQNKFRFALSRVDFCRWANVTKPTYLSAVQGLIDKGYLVLSKEDSNIYIFYENGKIISTEDDKNIIIPEEKENEIKEFKF